jgi:AraC family transcriptional regulator, regulatory protein of adaptative response / methylated-DNA-[protein]-cysteine methyltransferase
MGPTSNAVQQPQARAEDACWQATLARDQTADGTFVYAVNSTRIYCRPSCPSRKPARRHVTFFPTSEAAEGAGFRPCRRCRPQETGSADTRVALVKRACRLIDANGEERLSLDAISRGVGLSPHRLRRAFKHVTGITPREYAEARRLGRFKKQLKEGRSVTHALYDAGYGSSSRVYEHAKERLGMTPGTYRRGGQGLRIEYAIANSPVGRLLVAATPRGVCAVYLGDPGADKALVGALAEEYPAASVSQANGGVRRWIDLILEHLDGKQLQHDLPIDVRATAFQHRVWQQLQAIPYGETRSYREIAERLGAPGAARAVGRACATNPVSLIVPCHRAVREDGGLGGYRWGVDRKKRLLTHERGTVVRAGAVDRVPAR